MAFPSTARKATFMIVSPSPEDAPIYKWSSSSAEEIDNIDVFVLYAALDFVGPSKESACFLGQVDVYLNKAVYAWRTFSGYRFLLLLEPRNNSQNEELARKLFLDVNEIYMKILLNPLHAVGQALTHCPALEARLSQLLG